MITVLVLAALAALFGLCVPNLLRPMAPARPGPRTRRRRTGRARSEPPVPHPESMTAELDPGDEEYLASLADELWPDDEYLEPEVGADGEEENGNGMRR
ncbi:hypothetical protein [Spirillospora albida]|uniref:hypothetical protein n=1 Tax=Spirillospora albida TaxID=58123 RepID=UPI0005696752|nr:hypothetical protein [Spirillospora albida]